MKVLVIRFSSIGDILVTTPVLRCVKQQWKAELTFLTGEKFKTLLADNPYIDHIHTDVKGVMATRNWIATAGFDLIIDLHKNRKSVMMTLATGVKVVRYNKLNWQKWWYVQTKNNILPPIHLVDRYFESLAPLGLVNDGQGLDYQVTSLPADILLPPQYNVVILGAAHKTKRIPLQQCHLWVEKACWPVVCLGGNDVTEEGAILAQSHPNKVIDLTGKLTLGQSGAVLLKATGILTGDTGMMHMAAALKKEVKVLWGNTTPAFGMYPYYGGQNQVPWTSEEVKGLSCRPCSKLGYDACPKGHFRCMLQHKPMPW